MSAICQMLSPGRVRFQHGPIDLVIQAEGHSAVLEQAYAQARERFAGVLPTLVGELVGLRCAVDPGRCNPFAGPVARLMWQACQPLADGLFITPMAAVAGSVAQYMLEPFRVSGIDRAWANNGGDIALHLTAGTSLRLGLFSDLQRSPLVTGSARWPDLDGQGRITAHSGIAGVATSGWAGRSHSMGIADSVTVLAATASVADAAATLIANAVNVDDDLIVRQPASAVSDHTDLGERLITVHVPRLPDHQVAAALHRGQARAQAWVDAGLLESVVLMCQGQVALATSKSRLVVEEEPCHLS